MRVTTFLVGVGLMAATGPAPAAATTVSGTDGSSITIQGDAGVASDVVVRTAAGEMSRLVVEERGGTLRSASQPGDDPYCQALLARLALCAGSQRLPVVGRLGDRDDRASSWALPLDAATFWWLGGGDDTFTGGPGADSVRPGPGDDVVTGAEVVSYEDVAADNVHVSLDGIANDGQRGRGNVSAEVEVLIGSPGDDVLAGDDAPNRISGRGGNDVVDGGGGADDLDVTGGTLRGGAGHDRLAAGTSAGPVHVDGGDGADRVGVGLVSGHPATADLGPGDDALTVDWGATAPGMHLTVTCGEGEDIVRRVTDRVEVAPDCEIVEPAP